MRRPLRALLLLLALLPVAVQAAVLDVVVSVLPLKTFVEKVGGGHVRARSMVQPGQSPHSFEPTPRQVSELARADLYVRTGMPFEEIWMARFRAANAKMRVLDARAGIRLRPQPDADHGDEMDPHVWTSPPLAEIMAQNIRDTLAQMDPLHAADYAANYRVFAQQLRALDREIRSTLAGVRERRFMVFHPAWGYFAKTYGLTQIPVQREGKAPGAKALAALITQARRDGVKVVFVQPQFSARAARQLARAIGGRVESIDPLAPDYLDNMRRAARLVAQAAGA
jgi:zinc transport system substrate-binding protein